ncbi:MAG: hypothetical protein OEY41_07045 [Acidimicrobiia bacterium]|nr:hypothetical protein [Acidimicrobiia bacterium]MDH4362732.1 hypothetical protein [Acidimicrobiia bacterium]MDH5289739.1 hypothetical protein [Acidimicrobiia bacterium]
MSKVRYAGAALAAALIAGIPGVASADGGPGRGKADDAFVLAVTGDIPYSSALLHAYPSIIGGINADPDVDAAVHLGDIKSGSTLCSDEYFATIKADFDLFDDPLIYTPGDNEWTDCHRLNNGAYNPLERLAAIRRVFFPQPNVTLGRHPMRVESQARQGFPENVSFERADVGFAAVHVVGSNNSLAPWTGNTAPTPEQQAEVDARLAADLKLIRATFREARKERQRGVVLMMQADMFDPSVVNPVPAQWTGLLPVVQAIATEAARFRGPVLLLNGDSHGFVQDQPLAAGSPWLGFYGVTAPVPNLTRVTVEGSDQVDEWVKLTVQEKGRQVFTVERVPFAS